MSRLSLKFWVIKIGKGWRFGYCSQSDPYVALIGGETWAFELTKPEWQDLSYRLSQVLETIGVVKEELSDQERFDFIIDSQWWELTVEGVPDHWQLRLQTRSGRRAEGFLSSPAVMDLEAYLREQLPPDSAPPA